MSRTAAVALLLAMVCTGCGLPTDASPRRLEAQELRPASTGPTLRPGLRSTTLYLVRDAALAPVLRRTESAGSPRTALLLLLRGASPGESAQGLSTALDPGAVLLDDLDTAGPLVTVPLAASPAGLGRSDEVLAYAQVVATLTALPDVSAVQFVRDGRPLSVPRADGALVERPLTRRDYADLL